MMKNGDLFIDKSSKFGGIESGIIENVSNISSVAKMRGDLIKKKKY